MNLQEIKKYIEDSGVVGAGGAGFPTHVKLSDEADTVILNCAECEPLLKVDRQLLALYTEEILKAFSTVTTSLDAKEGIVAIKSSYKSTIAAVKNIIERYNNLKLKILPDAYPMGDEAVLVYEATGRIVPEGAIPIKAGVVVINTETVLNIYKAIFENKTVVEKYVTVAGEVNNPVTLRVPIGITVDKLINMAGGSSIKEYEILMGGPMTGRIVDEKSPVTKTTKAIIILDKSHPIMEKRHINISIGMKRAMSVCSQCRMCTDLCPRHLLGYSIEPHRIMNALTNGLTSDVEAFKMALLCCDCGLCEMYSCHQCLPPRTLIKQVKNSLLMKGVKNNSNRIIEKADEMREGRLVPMERLYARLSLTKYNVEANLVDNIQEANKVNILMRQHIGAPAIPCVKVGDMVNKHQLIGKIPEGKLGCNIHASIAGKITSVSDSCITVERMCDNIG